MSAAERIAKTLEETEYLFWSVLDSLNSEGTLENYVSEEAQHWYAKYENEISNGQHK